MNRFKVINAHEYATLGSRMGSAEWKQILAAEERAKNEREALAQIRREEYQARRNKMTPLEQAYEDLAVICAMPPSDNICRAISKQNRLINQLERLETLFEKYEKEDKTYG